MSIDENVIQIKCPHCGTPTVYSKSNLFRPFCSERCKMIDLGEWADEKYKVPVKETSSNSLITDDSGYEEDPN